MPRHQRTRAILARIIRAQLFGIACTLSSPGAWHPAVVPFGTYVDPAVGPSQLSPLLPLCGAEVYQVVSYPQEPTQAHRVPCSDSVACRSWYASTPTPALRVYNRIIMNVRAKPYQYIQPSSYYIPGTRYTRCVQIYGSCSVRDSADSRYTGIVTWRMYTDTIQRPFMHDIHCVCQPRRVAITGDHS